jgi:phage tail P2-like protein
MNKELKTADFYETFPPALKRDESMAALGRLIADELHITANEAEKNIIYARIDELGERWLDTLAYDLHVDWYDYDYPIETKRKILKNSIRVHQKLGTKYAVRTVLQDVYRTADVEEWFDYGGEPYFFRVTVDIGNEGLSEDTSLEIEKKMQFYKNLRSHCDGIFYRLSIEKATVQAVALHEVGTRLKVKPYLQRAIKAAGQNDIRAATLIGGKIKVKPILDGAIKAVGEKVVTAHLQALNSIKVKSYTESSLRAEMDALGSIKAYQRNKQTIIIRKEQ